MCYNNIILKVENREERTINNVENEMISLYILTKIAYL